MIRTYAEKLGPIPQSINVCAQTINGLPLEIYGIVIAEFSVHNKLDKAQFFEETFLLTSTNMEVVLGMPFLFLSNANLQFGAGELTWRRYTIAKAISITRQF